MRRVKESIPATIWFFVIELAKIPTEVKLAPKIIRKIQPPTHCSYCVKPKVVPCSGNKKCNRAGKQKAKPQIIRKNK